MSRPVLRGAPRSKHPHRKKASEEAKDRDFARRLLVEQQEREAETARALAATLLPDYDDIPLGQRRP